MLGKLLHQRYRLDAELGRGALGTAYRARDLVRGRDVALKVVPSEGGRGTLMREFTLLRGLLHPNLVRVDDYGRDGEQTYYVAELVEGMPWSAWVSGRPWVELEKPLGQVLGALAFLHGLGIRHGDVKPDNVLVEASGDATLLDLSCAESLAAADDAPALGTRRYRAPELTRGQRDTRSDLYSVGVMLGELTDIDGCPAPLRELVASLTAQSPADRPADVAEILEVLSLDGGPSASPLTHAGGFVAREAELKRAAELIEGLAVGQAGPRVLVLHGPEGIGRTRLLQEIKWRAQARLPVVEGWAAADDAVDAMLRRLVEDETLPASLVGLLDARQRLAIANPVVAILDDAERLAAQQRQRLDQIIRAASPQDRTLWIVADVRKPAVHSLALEQNALEAVHLEPLPEPALRAWLSAAVAEPLLTHVARQSGGVPAVAVALALGRRDEALSKDKLGELEQMRDSDKRLLATCVLGSDIAATPSGNGLDPIWSRLARNGWVRWDGARWKLLRNSDAVGLADALGAELITELRREAVEQLQVQIVDAAPHQRARIGGQLARHLAELDRGDELIALLAREEAAMQLDPVAFLPAVRRLAQSTSDADTLALCAEALSRAGDSAHALGIVARALRRRPQPEARARLRRRAAEIYLRQSRDATALRYLERARRDTVDATDRALVDDRTCTALVKLGQSAEALRIAEHTLDTKGLSARLKTSLSVSAGVAASYVGDDELARKHLARALASSTGASSFQRFRAESALALVEHRAGHTDDTMSHYEAALELAEKGEVTDQLPVALLNLGVAAHAAGDLGRTLDAYERGLSAAVAVDARSAIVALRFNMARLCTDLNLLERAARLVERGVEEAEAQHMPFMSAAFESIRGEIFLRSGEPGRALEELERVTARFRSQGADREVWESQIGQAQALTSKGEPFAALEMLEQLGPSVATLPDLVARLHLARGEAAARSGEPGPAIQALEQALAAATETGQRLLIAEIEATLAEVHDDNGAPFLARRHRAAARERLERAVATLPGPIRDKFMSSSYRAGVTSSVDDQAVDTRRLTHLMGINRRLSASLEVEDVLRHAMDAAIELTSAERGFLILREGDRHVVRVARNLDHEQVGRPQMKFSRSIAQRAIESGEPIITFDAGSDPRFAAEGSVHAMQLKSVACAPLRSGDEIRGALYVDNRFRRGGFRESDVQLLLAVADQVAIALRNAELHRALAERTSELEAERARIQELLNRREVEIDRLQHQLDTRGAEIVTRHDYAEIVGRSDAIKRVLSLIDRVTESDVSVLVEGESGTGKELIARALHANGPRAQGPFVAINCAALPDSLLEAELFGYRKGAFTDAVTDRDGLFVRARGGTVFLDELGEMSSAMQARLLRVLQEREVQALGASDPVEIDIRVVCATNRDLAGEVSEGRFREDLYYRVAVVVVQIPALRERLEDIPPIATHLLERIATEGTEPPRLGSDALSALLHHDYPGNIRELDNMLKRAAVLCTDGTIVVEDLGLPMEGSRPPRGSARHGFRPSEAVRMMEALRETGWNVAEAARSIGVPRATFYRRMKRYGIERT